MKVSNLNFDKAYEVQKELVQFYQVPCEIDSAGDICVENHALSFDAFVALHSSAVMYDGSISDISDEQAHDLICSE